MPQPFLIQFNLHDGSYTAVGTCTITSNPVPVPRLLLVTCGLTIVSAPAGVLGGSATSASVFNPLRPDRLRHRLHLDAAHP